MRSLIHAKYVYAPGFADADALIVDNKEISWVGQFSTAVNLDLNFDQLIDVPDYFVAPGFVDSHVHLSATGALLTGLNLIGVSTATDALKQIEVFASNCADQILMGHGWEDTNWPDSKLWNVENIIQRIGNRNFYFSRIDVHSAMVNTPMFKGVAITDDHHRVREFVQAEIPAKQRSRDILAALNLAAENGVVSVHENGAPAVSGQADFLDVMNFAKRTDVPHIVGYWGSLDLAEVLSLGAYGAAGDLTVDGSIGSRTALLSENYCDLDLDTEAVHGKEFLSVDQIAAHFIACTKANIQGGFHAIGDLALENVVLGLKKAEQVCGLAAVQSSRHRIEHAEMLNSAHLSYLRSLGVVLSMQPAFDELWGNQNGLYEQRLGFDRMRKMNIFAQIAKAGVSMSFSSDSPVTPIDPWRSIAAAAGHHNLTEQLSTRAAFIAHTRGGWRAAKDDVAGVIAEGAPAHLAFWTAEDCEVMIPDERRRSWSTDERSGTHPLPVLSSKMPECIATIRAGKPIYDPDQIWTDFD
jgi:predicted amidohydrolase YtcJ